MGATFISITIITQNMLQMNTPLPCIYKLLLRHNYCSFSAKPLSIKTDPTKGVFSVKAVVNVLCQKAKYTMIFGLKQTRLGIVFKTKTAITDVQPGNFYSFDVNRTILLPDSNHSLYTYTVTLLNTDGDILDGERLYIVELFEHLNNETFTAFVIV